MSYMKEVYDEITAIAEETGYSTEFLCERLEESVEDTGDYGESLKEVYAVSAEHDW